MATLTYVHRKNGHTKSFALECTRLKMFYFSLLQCQQYEDTCFNVFFFFKIVLY